jgi:hypothetical protein
MPVYERDLMYEELRVSCCHDNISDNLLLLSIRLAAVAFTVHLNVQAYYSAAGNNLHKKHSKALYLFYKNLPV